MIVENDSLKCLYCAKICLKMIPPGISINMSTLAEKCPQWQISSVN